MPDYTIKGTDGVEFGTEDADGLGVVVSARRLDTGEKRELKNRSGKTYAVIYFDDKGQCEFEAIYDSGLSIPARGGEVDIGGLEDCLVDEVEHLWENEKERMLRIRATKYDGVSLGGS